MVIFHADPAKPEVALMFDDGANPQVTPQLLDILKTKGVHATFFLIGARVEECPTIAQRIIQEGHEIGNHTYTHKRLTDVLIEHGPRAVKDEIDKGTQAIVNATGIEHTAIRFLRPPYLDWSKAVADVAAPSYGDRIILTPLAIEDYKWGADHYWDASNHGAIAKQTESIIGIWQEKTQNGTLLAFHDGAHYNLPGNETNATWMNRSLPTLMAIPDIIDSLRAKGFKLKMLREMGLIEERF